MKQYIIKKMYKLLNNKKLEHISNIINNSERPLLCR